MKKITITVSEKLHKKYVAALKKKKQTLTGRLRELIKGDLKV